MSFRVNCMNHLQQVSLKLANYQSSQGIRALARLSEQDEEAERQPCFQEACKMSVLQQQKVTENQHVIFFMFI